MSFEAKQSDMNPHFSSSGTQWSAIADAIGRGDAGLVRELASGMDLSLRGDGGVTLLQWAIFNQQLDCMKALLESGADPTQNGLGGDTAVHSAVVCEDGAYLDELLSRGVDVNASNDTTGRSPLFSAVLGVRVDRCKALLSAGADVDAIDRVGNRPLHVSGQTNKPEIALALLEAGADPSARNLQGATFQRYLFMVDADLVSPAVREQRDAVKAWLALQGVPVESAG